MEVIRQTENHPSINGIARSPLIETVCFSPNGGDAMKARISFGLLVSLLLLFGSLAPANAENPVAPVAAVIAGSASVSSPSSEAADEWPFLLWLRPPCAESREGCSGELLPTIYLQQAQTQMDQVLPILAELREQGLIVDFMPIPDANAVGVTAGKDALTALERLPGIEKISQGGAEAIRAAQQSLADVVVQASQAVDGPPVIQSAMAYPLTDPSVYVDDTFEGVWGYTTAGALVSVTLRNSGGSTKATATTTSSSNGYYSVSFWSVGIVPGDTVYVTVAGRTISVRVENLTARVEPATDYVRGTAPANRNIWVDVSSNPGCNSTSFGRWITSSSAGNYAANLAGSGNILRGDYVRIFVVDANSNGTMIVRYAPIARVNNLYYDVSGYTAPNAAVTAVLKNSAGGTRETRTTTANYYGYYYVYFSTAPVVGDRIEIMADGETMSVSIVTLTARVDAGANTVFGNGPGSGRQLKVQGCHMGVPYG